MSDEPTMQFNGDTAGRYDFQLVTVASPPCVVPGDLLDVGGDHVLVVAVAGCTLTIRPCPWWRWALSRLATALRRAKWWALCLVDRLGEAILAR